MPGVNLGGAQLQPEGAGDRPAWRQFRSSCFVDTAGALERRRVPRSPGFGRHRAGASEELSVDESGHEDEVGLIGSEEGH